MAYADKTEDTHRSPETYLAMRYDRMKRNTVTSLAVAAQMWPTPRGANARQARLESHHQPATAGQLNPQFVEWLMGFHIKWTDLEDLETPSSHK